MTDKKSKINEETALVELKAFLKKFNEREFRRGKLKDDVIKEQYIDILEGIMDGLIVFDSKMKPTFNLRYPIETESKDKDLGVYQVEFRTRIKPSTKADLMDGLNPEKSAAKFSLRFMAYITGLSISELDKLEQVDYDVLNQICSVF